MIIFFSFLWIKQPSHKDMIEVENIPQNLINFIKYLFELL
jgi:hypothetical protein